MDRGLINLDGPLSRYLPEPYISGDDRINRITARIVLDHTTGFPNWRPRDQPIRIFFMPGEKFSYSGEGYVYLQKVVERITGKPLNDLMKETVFAPLGMSASSYVWRADYDRLSATGHNLGGGAVKKGKPSQANAAASLHTTALDYARFVIAVMNGTGLEARSSRMMLTPQSTVDERCTNCTDRTDFHPSASLSWGLGWGLEKPAWGTSYWHWGDNGVFRCFVMASRQTRNGVVMFTNSENGLAIAGEVVRLALGGEHPAIAWLRYDQYDTPAMKFVMTALDEGAAGAIDRYRKMHGAPKEEEVNRLGYAFLGMKKLDDAVRLFEWNVELYPKSYNVYDSLAEAYAARGDKERAIRFYKKSLELNPDNTNAREKLKDLIQ
jgi:CubicO group peptidase (beta-lactamase class C family)